MLFVICSKLRLQCEGTGLPLLGAEFQSATCPVSSLAYVDYAATQACIAGNGHVCGHEQALVHDSG